MKKKYTLLALIVTALISASSFLAKEGTEVVEDWNSAQKDGIIYSYYHGGEDAAYESIVEYMNYAVQKPTSNLIQYFINQGRFSNHVEELKALGFTDVDYSPVLGGGSKSNTTQQVTQTPEPFTVEPYNPVKTMWATSEVNCRTGAGTSYQKVGSLKKHEEVKVTGVASNGWYEITKEDGTKIYVSNKYLSEENPSDRVVYDVNEETGKVTTYEFKDTDPEVIDEKVEELTATPEPTVAPTEKPTPTPTVEPTIAPTAEPTPYVVELTEEEIKQLPEETQDELKTDGRNYIGFIVLAVAFVGIVAIVVIRNHKKR
ncbi:MAG: SH3 domain-containing protein [Lachnospiraceae bacterium]|nr:SH3 domain-containing protein [Lachnospiraceae bacterium]